MGCSGSDMLKIEFVLSAIKLTQSFASAARSCFQSGDYDEGFRNEQEAEYFYSQARRMLRTMPAADSSLIIDLAELRSTLDDLHIRRRFATA